MCLKDNDWISSDVEDAVLEFNAYVDSIEDEYLKMCVKAKVVEIFGEYE